MYNRIWSNQRGQLPAEVEVLCVDAASYRHLRKVGLVLKSHEFMSAEGIGYRRIGSTIVRAGGND